MVTERPEFPKLVDSTMRGAYKSCPQKFFREFLQGLAPKGMSEHLVFGASYARGLEVVRRLYYERGVTLDDALIEGIAGATIEWGNFEPPEHSPKQYTRMIGALVEYFEEHRPGTDWLKPHMRDGKACVEICFSLPIPDTAHPVTGDPILYGGRFDMIGEDHTHLWVEDDKTAMQLGNQWLKQWELRGQLTGYCWAAKTFGFPVAGAIIRGLSILKTKYGHAQAIEYRNDWEIERWLYQLSRDVNAMIENWKEGYWDFALDSACASYGGCPMLPLCTKKDPEPWINQYYEVRRWDPTKKNPAELIIPSGREMSDLTLR